MNELTIAVGSDRIVGRSSSSEAIWHTIQNKNTLYPRAPGGMSTVGTMRVRQQSDSMRIYLVGQESLQYQQQAVPLLGMRDKGTAAAG